MKKIGTKVFLVILSCSLLSLLILGGICIRESRQQMKEETETSLLWMAKDYADQLSRELTLTEDHLSELSMFLENSLDLEQLQQNRKYLAAFEPRLATYLETLMEEHRLCSAWVYFDPSWSDQPHDVHFIDEGQNGSLNRQAYLPLSSFQSTSSAAEMPWWYAPMEAGGTVWTKPHSWNLSNQKTLSVISCARPLYHEGKLIGVYGIDYSFDRLSQKITQAKVYQNGTILLYNEALAPILPPTTPVPSTTGGSRTTPGEEANGDLTLNLLTQQEGLCPYSENGKERIMAYSTLSNAWILGISLPASELYSDANSLLTKLLLAIFVCVLLSSVAAYSMGRYLSTPILQLAHAAKRIGNGDFSVRTHLKTRNELQQLADSMNRMTENIDSLQKQLTKQAYYDDLTGAKNFVKFKLDATELLVNHPGKHYALIKFDVDKFKVINVLHGYETGNRILCQISNALSQALDPSMDTFARIAADEFVLLISYHDPDELDAKRRRFLKLFWGNDLVSVDFGVLFKEGLYHVAPHETDISLLFEKVNLAHRIAKQQEGKTICIYGDNIEQISIEEKAIENSMQKALELGEFRVYFQPKYRLTDERIVGAEVLVRWQSEFGGFLTPNRFIPLFERNGFIQKLDFYMLEQACLALRSWLDQGLPPITISVNFSRIHLNNPNFLKKMCDLVDQYQIPRPCIEIELTESVLIYHSDTLILFSNKLQKTGLKLSMDDFGSGYSSLGLLKSISVDAIKLDQSFFMDAEDEKRTFAVLSAIIMMAKNLDISVVAEGVEEEKHILLLKRLGCDMVQGYYYAKPMPFPEFLSLYKQNQESLDENMSKPSSAN